jgi:hypothetical protein
MKHNKLIAEFMEVDYIDVDTYLENNKELKYHTSWDWLMPVIRQINEVSNYNDYCKDRLHLQRVLDDCINENAVGIDEVYKAVVEFINECNK